MTFSRHRRKLCFAASFILLLVIVPHLLALPFSQDQPPCTGSPECVGEPPTLTPLVIEPETSIVQQSPSWGGYSDGRLNPDMAEYYSVWCHDNVIQVLRAVPSPDSVADIPLAEVNELSDGGSLVANNVIVLRTGDTITLYGNNGNLAPQSGSKSFSLSQCNERNGGAPQSEPPVAPMNPPVPPPQNAADTSRCLDELYFRTHLRECGDAADNGISLLWRLINAVCYPLEIVPSSFLSVMLFRNRRKRK